MGLRVSIVPVWCLVGNGGMDYGDYYWGLYRGYYRDPFTKNQTAKQYSELSARRHEFANRK